jgi:hypothetical protein
MKILFFLSLLIPCFLFSQEANTRATLELEQSNFKAGEITLNFKLYDQKLKKYLRPEHLEIVHEKKLHSFVYDRALEGFQHIHPEFKRGIWTLTFNIEKNGVYFFWVQGATLEYPEEFKSSALMEVSGGTEENTWPATLVENRTGCDAESCISLSGEPLWVDREVMPTVNFFRTDNTSPVLGIFLGEKAHAIVTNNGGNTLAHVHPMDHGVENQLMLHMHFEDSGMHRIWVQFIDHDILRTVPLQVEVFERGTLKDFLEPTEECISSVN